MVIEGDQNMGGEDTMQYTNDVLQNFTPEHYMLLINVTQINSIKNNAAMNK